MATNYGRDLWARRTLVTTREAKGIDVLVNALVRRITTPKGTNYYHPDYGVDVEIVGEEIRPGTILRFTNELLAQVQSDNRVVKGSVFVDVKEVKTATVTNLEYTIRGDSELGPFDFVTTVDRVTLELLGVKKKVAA